MQKKLVIVLLIVVLAFISACNLKHFTAGDKQKMLINELLDSVENNELVYTHLSIKFSGNLKVDNKSQRFSGNFRIFKDSIIWVSIQKLNIEGARILIRPDSVFLINRTEKTYSSASIDEVLMKYSANLNFEVLQALLTNNLYLLPSEDSTLLYVKYRPCKDDSKYCLNSNTIWKNKMIVTGAGDTLPMQTNHTIKIIPDIFRPSEVQFVETPYASNFLWQYLEQKNFDSQFFPSIIKIFSEMGTQNIEIEININRLSFREEQSYPFKISKKYSRMDF